MNTEIKPAEKKEQKMEMKIQGGSGSPVYGLGMIGAWVYYIGRANNFQEGVQGFLKGLVWPAFLVHDLFVYLEDKE
jgi:hypothetical protein